MSIRNSIKIDSWQKYQEIYSYSIQENKAFWAQVAQEKIKWRAPWREVSESCFEKGHIRWFLDGQLNVSENCVDRHLESGKADQTALIWVGNHENEVRRFTFRELHAEVCRVAVALEKVGIQKGDRVVLYLPSIPELAISLLACARIGAIHSVIFGGFSAQAIQSRIHDCQAKLVITADGGFRGDKWIDLKKTIDQALALNCPSVQNVIVLSRHHNQVWKPQARDLRWEDFIHDCGTTHVAPAHDANDPLFILYTSGSTGKPKGVLHGMGGYITYASYTHEMVFQPKPSDVYWCTADLGWITGHSYLLYGPLANGITTFMYEGVPTFPDPGRFWKIIDEHQVNILYTAPTAIRILASFGDSWVKQHSRQSLRTLGTVGEPINPEAWQWYSEVVGDSRCPIVDTWWQTETGGILISPLAGITPLKPGCATYPLPGIRPQIIQDSLVIEKSWPGQMIGVYGDPERFQQTYLSRFPGVYATGDSAHKDHDGMYWIKGREDDVIKVSGHRLGTAEIESACIILDEVIESAAVGLPDEQTGESLHVFAVLKPSVLKDEALTKKVISVIRQEVGPVATPKKIHWISGLPKTRSGKIMRRVLRKIATGQHEEIGDTSSLSEPGIISQLIRELT